jgi:hypothetical protein
MVKRSRSIFELYVSVVGVINVFLATAFQPTSNVGCTYQLRDRKHPHKSTMPANHLIHFRNDFQFNKEIRNDRQWYHSSTVQVCESRNRNTYSRSKRIAVPSFHLNQTISQFVMATTTNSFLHLYHAMSCRWKKIINSHKIRKYVITFLFTMTLMISTAAFAAGTSGGRVGGGSFKTYAPSSSSMSRPSRSYAPRTTPRNNYHSRPRMLPSPRIRYYQQLSSPIVVHHFSGAPIMSPYTALAIKDVLLLTGTGTLIAYALAKNAYRNREPDDTYGITAGGNFVHVYQWNL